MKRNVLPLLVAAAVLLTASLAVAATAPDAGLGPWKAMGKLRLPSRPVSMLVSDDNNRVFALCPEKRRRDSGGVTPGFVEITVLRCYAADTGKQIFARDMSELSETLALRANSLALPDIADRITVYDVPTMRAVTTIDTRSPNDHPPNEQKVPDALKNFGGGGRLGDFKLTADAKTLVTVRMENTAWKKKGFAWTSESFQRVVFWDAYKGAKLGTLDCEDKNATNPRMTLLPRRNQALIAFDNGARLLDIPARKWAKVLPVKDVYFAAVAPDEKSAAITDHDQGVKVFGVETGKLLTSFKERLINKMPRFNRGPFPGRYQFGPTVHFVDDSKVLRVVLNDRKTILYRSATTGKKVNKPASETMKFPGGPARVVAVSRDRHCAVTTSFRPSAIYTVWQRGPAKKE
jgi:hypothetical protein